MKMSIILGIALCMLLLMPLAMAVKSYKDNVAPDANNGHGNDRDHCDESNPSGNCPHKVSEPSLYVMMDEPLHIVCGTGLYC